MHDHETQPHSLPRLADDESIERARKMRDRLKNRRSCRYLSDQSVPREVSEDATVPLHALRKKPLSKIASWL